MFTVKGGTRSLTIGLFTVLLAITSCEHQGVASMRRDFFEEIPEAVPVFSKVFTPDAGEDDHLKLASIYAQHGHQVLASVFHSSVLADAEAESFRCQEQDAAAARTLIEKLQLVDVTSASSQAVTQTKALRDQLPSSCHVNLQWAHTVLLLAIYGAPVESSDLELAVRTVVSGAAAGFFPAGVVDKADAMMRAMMFFERKGQRRAALALADISMDHVREGDPEIRESRLQFLRDTIERLGR